MEKAAIRVLNDCFELIGEVDEVQNIVFTRRNCGVGGFTLVINGDLPGASLFVPGHMVMMGTQRQGYVEAVETQLYAQGAACTQLTVTGRTLEHLLTYRITVPMQAPMPQNAEALVKALVAFNMGATADPARRIPNLEVAPLRGIGGEADWSWGYRNLVDDAVNICAQCELGLRMCFDAQRKKFVFDVVQGADRRTVQHHLPPVILSPLFDSVFEQTHIESTLDMKNVVLAGGAGEGPAQAAVWVGDGAEGLGRREVFVENKSIQAVETEKLMSIGKQALYDFAPVQSLDSGVNPFHTLQFERDYCLGDLVTIKWGERVQHKQLTEVTESWDEQGYGLTCVLGRRAPDLLDKMMGYRFNMDNVNYSKRH